MANISYRDIGQMNDAILKSLYKIPHDIDLVVGIPRSGMLPANLVALYLNKPFTDIDSFIDGRIYSSGERGKDIDLSNIRKVLIMDDSICSGNALNKAKTKLGPLMNQYDCVFGVVYATTLGSSEVDFYCEIIDGFRVFEWNIFHHTILSKACLDMDGVLCVDPPIDDDGEKYIKYIENAMPLYIPKVKIGTIVTCRLEKYREITEKWLSSHGVNYEKLIMLPFNTKEERIKWGKHGEYKSKVFKELDDSILFIESTKAQAEIIVRKAQKAVFCTEDFKLYNSKKDKLKVKIKGILPDFAIKYLRKIYKVKK